MSTALQTILYGTFVPPDVAGRLIAFDERPARKVSTPVAVRKGPARNAVIEALKQHPHEWMTISAVAAVAWCCDGTARTVLNKLASEQIILKRFSGASKRGGKNFVFKWKNQDAKKQKAA